MTEIRINRNLCRLCGCKNENGQSLSENNGAELLFKVQETFSMLVSGNDPLPHNICIQCEQDVNVFYIKIKRFRALEKKWRDEVQKTSPTHPYLKMQQSLEDDVDKLRTKINTTFDALTNENAEFGVEQSESLESAELSATNTNVNISCDDKVPMSIDFDPKQLERIDKDRKKRQKRKPFMVGYVRSRKLKRKMKGAKAAMAGDHVLNPASIDVMNAATIPKVDVPYKKFRNAMLEIMSQNEILEHRTRVNRRASQPFNYSHANAQPPRSASPKKFNRSMPYAVKKELINNNNSTATPAANIQLSNADAIDTLLGGHGRNRRRINYSEELVDEAFMYEQILDDKQHQQEKRKRSISKLPSKSPDGSMAATAPSTASGNIDSRLRLLEQRNEISIVPVKSRLMTNDMHNDGKMPMPIKTEPLFNITSSVSVHIKSRKSESSNIQISNITSLCGNRETPPTKRRKISCKYCSKVFTDEKQLATHQIVHLSVVAFKIDEKRILHPKLRRGRMLNLDDGQFIRCVNCWMLHTNNKSILDHWNNGACLFYCSVCGKSFHDSIKDLQSHTKIEHGIKVRPIKVHSAEKSKEPVKEAAKKPAVVETKKIAVAEVKKQPEVKKMAEVKTHAPIETQPMSSSVGFHCAPCSRTFGSRKALNTHHTLIHKKKPLRLNPPLTSGSVKRPIASQTINPLALLSDIPQKSTNQKAINKKWKRHTNEAVMKTVIRKAPPPLKKRAIVSTQTQPIKLAESTAPKSVETLMRCSTSPSSVSRNNQETEISQDQTVSSTYLSAPITEPLDDLQIKPEPLEEYSNNYVELPVQSCNGWVHLPPQYDEWNYGNVNGMDPYIDTSPRLKVKDLTDLQDPKQPRYQMESQAYAPSMGHKEHPVIVPNQNMSGLQIQNVQSYQTHSMQPQPYADYSCVNSMNSMNANMNLTEHEMCTSNIYEMHVSQAQPVQPVQSTQLINPYMLPPNPTHTGQDYPY